LSDRVPRVLVVDDDAGVRYTIRELLESLGLTIEEAADGVSALAATERESFDVVITDLRMPAMDGMTLLRRLIERSPRPRVVMITAHGSERQAVDAMKLGAYDYLKKPFENDDLIAIVGRAVEAVRLAGENERLSGELALSRSMVIASPAMSQLAVLVARVAPRDVNVLITGESGTGKERIAEALVRASKRADKPFIRFNCAAVTAELAEAELFGHSRGAFTGAIRARPGLFREADSGTILLDEVGELQLSTQGKLLRVLQDGEVRPVGEDRPHKVDVRVLSATHRDLRAQVEKSAFREDLFYRLNVVHLHVPPLRERPEEIAVLARHFLDRFFERFGLPPVPPSNELLRRLAARRWSGNVRELEHAIESLVALSPPGSLDLALLQAEAATTDVPALTLKARVDAYERGLIIEALRASRGNRSEAARILGVSRVTLHDKLNKFGLRDVTE
jgi:DNA-binding NtrC family response regulator